MNTLAKAGCLTIGVLLILVFLFFYLRRGGLIEALASRVVLILFAIAISMELLGGMVYFASSRYASAHACPIESDSIPQ
ncbi:hypothetical protein ACFOY4_25175 [Actinomadura syzygii]|uniref:Uncharacterized protein n=1 Tax=Actinomadura syzygii TaxID=1427538 RepID=A0A5D0UIT6_9ACTN|nr:hypothetical protein [Actinomadura syzygii]TYC18298.1 hypothetical protein FXF65_00555 [Actinomadura syzygii]